MYRYCLARERALSLNEIFDGIIHIIKLGAVPLIIVVIVLYIKFKERIF